MKIKISEKFDRNVFFISDTHFYHKNVIKFDNRPFLDDDGESDILLMNETLINNWNSKVSKTDIVFLMGDIVFGGVQKTKEIVDQLNGEIHVVVGNHDSVKLLKKTNRFSSINDRVNLYIESQLFILDHFPLLVWDKCHKGSIHLHGHCHGSLIKSNPDFYKGKVMDIGANSIDYAPISYKEVIDIMGDKNITPH